MKVLSRFRYIIIFSSLICVPLSTYAWGSGESKNGSSLGVMGDTSMSSSKSSGVNSYRNQQSVTGTFQMFNKKDSMLVIKMSTNRKDTLKVTDTTVIMRKGAYIHLSDLKKNDSVTAWFKTSGSEKIAISITERKLGMGGVGGGKDTSMIHRKDSRWKATDSSRGGMGGGKDSSWKNKMYDTGSSIWRDTGMRKSGKGGMGDYGTGTGTGNTGTGGGY